MERGEHRRRSRRVDGVRDSERKMASSILRGEPPSAKDIPNR